MKNRVHKTIWLLCIALLACPVVRAADTAAPAAKPAEAAKPAASEKNFEWSFEKTAVGKLPGGWKTMSAVSTSGKKAGDTCPPHAIFEVVKVESGKALKLVKHDQAVYDDGHHCWTDKVAFTDGTLSARVMAEDTVKGHCGLAFRIQDHKNFYAVRYAICEGKIALVRVKDGMPVWDSKAQVSTGDAKGPNKWFNLKVEVAGNRITAFVDDKQMFQYTDADALAGTGGVGLFSRGDQAVVLWDDFKVECKPAEEAKSKPMQLTVRFETSTTQGRYSPRNVHAVWVQTKAGGFVRTLGLWGNKHAKQLTDFKAAVGDLAAAVQARTGATEQAYGAYSIRWDMMDAAGTVVPDGDYVLQFELTSDNADKNKRHRASVPFTKNDKPATIELTEMSGYKNIVLDYQVAAGTQ